MSILWILSHIVTPGSLEYVMRCMWRKPGVFPSVLYIVYCVLFCFLPPLIFILLMGSVVDNFRCAKISALFLPKSTHSQRSYCTGWMDLNTGCKSLKNGHQGEVWQRSPGYRMDLPYQWAPTWTKRLLVWIYMTNNADCMLRKLPVFDAFF